MLRHAWVRAPSSPPFFNEINLILVMNYKKFKLASGSLILLLGLIPIVFLPITLFCLGYVFEGFFVILVYYILDFWFLMLAYYDKRSDIQTKITWTFIQFFAPGVGAYIYFLIGRIPKKFKKVILPKLISLENEYLNTNISNSDIEILENGRNTFPRIFEDLKKAKKYINIQYFILTEGIMYDELFEILRIKKAEGVKIRILIDYFGSHKLTNSTVRNLRNEGFEIFQFQVIKFWKISGIDNWRSHNKIITIDGEKCYFGGMNFADEYASLDPKYGEWLDLHYRGKGLIVYALDMIFSLQWYINSKEEIFSEFSKYKNIKFKSSNQDQNIEIMYDAPYKRETTFFSKIKKEIISAKTNIKIITPYICFPISLKDSIRQAILNGVKIEIITIGKYDKKSVYYQGTFDVETLTDLGVKIYRVKDTFIHTKLFIFDDEKTIFGTTNLDYRSLFHHYEINVVVQSSINEQLLKYFDNIKNISKLNTKSRENWKISRKINYLFVRLFKGIF
ncbi:MAG: cardiolipin synthase [Candidatus Tyloplasma litorale]|nr:MAG: cardiolipin synthase [Mycoplasmatales bacterium]